MKPKISWPVELKDATRSSRGTGKRGKAAPRPRSACLNQLLEQSGAEVLQEKVAEIDVRRSPRRSTREGTEVTVIPAPEIETAANERVALLVQHEATGAIQIRLPDTSSPAPATRRGASVKAKRVVHHFTLEIAAPEEDEPSVDTGVKRRQPRGLLRRVIRYVVVKLVGKLAQKGAAFLIGKWEQHAWAKRPRGWLRVSFANKTMSIRPVALGENDIKGGPCLLLVHGTFSNTTSCFADLAKSAAFVSWAQARYGDRIFAFNHYTMSETPEENARALLAGLPTGGPWSFDVVTHSRGGLVMRQMMRPGAVNGTRFLPQNVVLVASPNAGTPLVTSDRWDEVLTLFANLGDLFPAIGDAVSWAADALNWIAGVASDELKGLASMNMTGEQIRRLETSPAPATARWHALVANWHPDRNNKLWLRLADAGVDRFFQSANDLVVPAEGGWKLHGRDDLIKAAHIGCFGPGGNIANNDPSRVHHINFFEQPEAITFLTQTLQGSAAGLPALNPSDPLPSRGGRRGGRLGAPTPGHAEPPSRLAATRETPVPAPREPEAAIQPATVLRPVDEPDTLSIVILGGSREYDMALGGPKKGEAKEFPPKLLATFGNSQVLIDFHVRNAKANGKTDATKTSEDLACDDGRMGTRFQKVIAMSHSIRDYTDGETNELPGDDVMLSFGRTLFELLMRPEVLRLYDIARSRRAGCPLYVTFTSQIPWVAGHPWEFVFDPTSGGSGRLPGDGLRGSGSFIATGDVIFSRNVLTPRPSALPVRHGPLRILVVSAQPLNAARLSIAEEEVLLRRGFEDLVDAGLAIVQTLPRANPMLLQRAVATAPYDVVHFITHGEFDREREEGGLLFQDERGHEWPVSEEELCLLLCHRGIRVVFLNACETAVGGKRRFNSGMAAALVESGIPAVVANQFSVDDLSATVFAQHFYWHLGHGLSVGQAAREARIGVRCFVGKDSIDWAVPVLYCGNPRLQLCEPTRVPMTVQVTATAPGVAGIRRRRRHADDVVSMAVWDVAYNFPQLRQTLARLNAVQRVFVLETVDGSVPIGIPIRNIARNSRGECQFDAVRAEAKLRNLPAALDADLVACIIDQPISDAEDSDLYMKGFDAAPVTFTSTQKFREKLGWNKKQPSTAAPTAETRFIAMVVVSTILWHRSDSVKCLSDTPKCILFFDHDYDMPFLTLRPVLCPKCRQAFRYNPAPQRTNEVLAALDAMMGAFY
ncbi:MAG TPA: hypothetical protein DDZ88_31240 [Verrucomicrobiales bacterium]|nr:hypothetical protein [Verrucomicrobiales bacterium]